MRVLITGGAGFIGANLVHRLEEMRFVRALRVLDDFSSGSPERLEGHDIELWNGSILDPDALREAADGVDAIVHLAALVSVPESNREPLRYHEVNATGTLRVLEAARSCNAHVILASSAAVYGRSPALPTTEDSPTAPQSVYASSKLAAEAHAFAYANAYELPVLVFRFFNVFGPLQAPGHAYAAVVPAFLSAALDGRPLTVHGDGLQSRDMVSVGSVTAVISDALARRVTHPEPVNLAFGTRRTLLDIITTMEHLLGRRLERVHAPPRPGDVRHSQADHTTLRALFPSVDAEDFQAALCRAISLFR